MELDCRALGCIAGSGPCGVQGDDAAALVREADFLVFSGVCVASHLHTGPVESVHPFFLVRFDSSRGSGRACMPAYLLRPQVWVFAL